MDIVSTGTSTTKVHNYRIDNAEPIVRNHSRARLRPILAMVVLVDGRFNNATIFGPRVAANGKDSAVIIDSRYNDLEDAPEVVLRAADAAQAAYKI